MRITLVVHQFPPRYFTGTEQYAFAVGSSLRRRGHDVDVFALDPAFGEATGPFRVVHEQVGELPVTRVNYWMWLHRDWRRLEYRHPWMAEVFGEHLRARDSDVVHSFHLRHVGADLIDVIKAQGRGLVVHLTDFWFLCPQVTLVRRDGNSCGGPPDGGRGCLDCIAPELAAELQASPVRDELLALQAAATGLSRAETDLYSRVATVLERPGYLQQRLLAADAILAPTRFLRETFAHNGVPAERLQHQPYGIDVDRIRAGLLGTHAPQRPLTFGFLGTLSPHKGPHVLIDALQRVHGPCRVVLRGRATDFPDYAGPLLTRAAADTRVCCLDAFAAAELPSVLASIDVLVVPSLWHENAPFVVLEARAAGLPVLASDQGGLAEVVRHEVDGELFRPGDAADLAARMQRLLDEPLRLSRYQQAVEPPSRLDAVVDELEALYRGAARR